MGVTVFMNMDRTRGVMPSGLRGFSYCLRRSDTSEPWSWDHEIGWWPDWMSVTWLQERDD